ncbi:MAG: HAD family phosphatase [Treponema sp.]|nr:HAD family phosphatase [Treponema sp.]
MLKGLIFDADGTLIDSMHYWMEVTPCYLSERGKKSSKELERRLFSMSIEQGARVLHDECGITESAEEIKNGILEVIKGFYKNDIQLKKGAYQFLSKMNDRNVPMCIATAGNEVLLESALVRLDCMRFFKEIYTCGKLGTDKSKPDIFFKAAHAFNASPGETVVFEDALVPVATAKKAGFNVIAVQDSFSLNDELEIRKNSDVYVKDFYDFQIESFLNLLEAKERVCS